MGQQIRALLPDNLRFVGYHVVEKRVWNGLLGPIDESRTLVVGFRDKTTLGHNSFCSPEKTFFLGRSLWRSSRDCSILEEVGAIGRQAQWISLSGYPPRTTAKEVVVQDSGPLPEWDHGYGTYGHSISGLTTFGIPDMVVYDGIRKEGIRRLSLKEGLRAKGFPLALVDKVSGFREEEELRMLQDIGRTTPLGIAIVGLCAVGKGGLAGRLEEMMYEKFIRYLSQGQDAAGWTRIPEHEQAPPRFPA